MDCFIAGPFGTVHYSRINDVCHMCPLILRSHGVVQVYLTRISCQPDISKGHKISACKDVELTFCSLSSMIWYEIETPFCQIWLLIHVTRLEWCLAIVRMFCLLAYRSCASQAFVVFYQRPNSVHCSREHLLCRSISQNLEYRSPSLILSLEQDVGWR